MSETPNQPRQSLKAISEPSLLKRIWKKYLRSDLRNPRPQAFELGHDPLEHLPTDWDLDAIIREISDALQGGSYRAGAPEIIRAAKGKGLTRPLAYLKAEDAIVYKTIIQIARASLKRHSKPWTSFGRVDPTLGAEDKGDYSWFILWLQQDKRRWEIISAYPFIVVTDIANFFPYVPVSGVASHVLSRSNLDEIVVHLLVRILEDFGHMHLYRQTASVGLPQEGFDCSRILAHTYLTPLDEEFGPEGLDGRYTRHVDDIVVGVDSEDQGLGVIARVQAALEGLGLYPNPSKTEIILTADIGRRWFRDTNDYLGEVESRLDANEEEDLGEFEERFLEHLHPKEDTRFRSQVTKRFITLSRRLRSEVLLSHWLNLLASSPETARHLFDYLSTFPLTSERVEEIKNYAVRFWGLYEDVDLLIHEYLCSAPNSDEDNMRAQLGDWALRIARQQFHEAPRRASAATLTVGKHGTQEQILALAPLLDEEPHIDHVARRQVAIVLAGARQYTPDELLEKLPNPSKEASRDLRFLKAVRNGETRAIKMSLALAKPARRRNPDRYVFRVRCLFLAPLIAKGGPLELIHRRPAWRKSLDSMDQHFRDKASERWLGL